MININPKRIQPVYFFGGVVFLTFFIFFIWAYFTDISMGAHAKGVLVSDGYPRQIQVYEGGLVKAVHIVDGQLVKMGDVLIELDDVNLTARKRAAIQKISQLDKNINILSFKLNATVPLVKDGLIADVNAKEIEQQLLLAKNQLGDAKLELEQVNLSIGRSVIRASVDGSILALKVHTPGSTLSSGQLVAQIVPLSEDLFVEAKILPSNIDAVEVGQLAEVRFITLPKKSTAILRGTIVSVAKDRSVDDKTGGDFFLARVNVDKSEFEKLYFIQNLTAGMPVEVLLQAGKRNVWQYFISPWTDLFYRAMHER